MVLRRRVVPGARNSTYLSFRWLEDPQIMVRRMEEWEDDVWDAIIEVHEEVAAEVEAWAKANAPWNDDTGDARDQLSAFVEYTANQVTLTLVHGVFYGVYLEMKGYNIISPALEAHYAVLMDRLRAVVSG